MKNENESMQDFIVTRSMLKRMRDRQNTQNISNKKHKVIDTNITENNDNNLKKNIKENSFFPEFNNISFEESNYNMSDQSNKNKHDEADNSVVSEKIEKKTKKSANKNLDNNNEKTNYIELDVDELANVLTSEIINEYVEKNKKSAKMQVKNKKKLRNKKGKSQKKSNHNNNKLRQIKKYGGYYNKNDEFIIPDEEDIKSGKFLQENEDTNEDSNVDLDEVNPWDEKMIEKHKKELLKKNKSSTTITSTDSETETDLVLDLEYSSDSESELDEKKEEVKEKADDLGLTGEQLEEMSEEELLYWKKLNKEQRDEYLSLEKEIENFSKEDVPERYRLLKFPIGISSKSMIMKKIEQLSFMEVSDPEYFKLGKWVDGILGMPFGKYIDMPVKVSDGHKSIYNFLYDVNNVMEKSVYGHTEAKNKILQVVSQWISNPLSSGNIIALQGPPGIGKTSLVKNGISKALKRPFSMIALGGATDSSSLEGHNYTYEGSTWGRIANILMESKCMNPIIFFDELDKISETKHGEEIVGVLTHLTDQTQNNSFFDKYFNGIPFDLSRVLFVFSYNDDSRINPILKDRLIRIPLKGFSKENKILIAKDYLIPELCINVGMDINDLVWEDSLLAHIITNYTEEEGVRELRRHIENIYLKINMLRFIEHPENEKNKKDKKIELTYHIPDLKFPYTLTNEVVDKLITKINFEIPMSDGAKMMYI